MALINNLYIFVESEQLEHDVESSSHPVEKGAQLTDHIRRKPPALRISGKIVDYENQKASEILDKVKQMQIGGSLITYMGRNLLNNMQIQDFSTSHPYTNAGGCDFSMSLKQVKIAKPAYVAPTSTAPTNHGGAQQIETGENTSVYHTVKAGDTVWGLVITGAYKSLDPKYPKPADKCNLVMNQNPSAFSRQGDFGTLQVGKKILVGYRK